MHLPGGFLPGFGEGLQEILPMRIVEIDREWKTDRLREQPQGYDGRFHAAAIMRSALAQRLQMGTRGHLAHSPCRSSSAQASPVEQTLESEAFGWSGRYEK